MPSCSITSDEYQTLYSTVFGYFCRRITQHEDAEDLTSSTVSDYLLYDKPVTNPKALLWTIARNKLYKYIRQKGVKPLTGWDESFEDSAQFAVQHDEMKDFRSSVSDFARSQLKKIEFDVVELSVLCGFDSRRVAAELGISRSNVRQKLSRSLKKLRERFPHHWFDIDSHLPQA